MQSCGISSDSIIEESEEGVFINVIEFNTKLALQIICLFSNDHSPAFGSLRRQHERNKILLMDVNDDAGVSISDCKLVLVM